MIKGKTYRCVGRRFPFECPYGVYVERTSAGWLRFVWNGKELLMNGGDYEEADVLAFPKRQQGTTKLTSKDIKPQEEANMI